MWYECVSAAMNTSMVVENLSVFEEGDHIKWKRLAGYDHHAIVERVDHEAGKVHVIEYGSDKGGYSFGKGVVRRYEVDDMTRMYKYIYDKCDDTVQVLQRAISRLGERQYGPVRHNCEHFARWCKTGKKHCSQISYFTFKACLSGLEGVNGGVVAVFCRCLAKCGADAAKKGTTTKSELRSLLTCDGPEGAGVIQLKVVDQLCDAVVEGGKEMRKGAPESRLEVAMLLYESVQYEFLLFLYSCYKAQRNYKAVAEHAENDDMKQRCKEDRNREIKEAACEALAGAVGGIALSAVMRRFSVSATAVGMLVGNVAGRFLGKMFGRWFFY